MGGSQGLAALGGRHVVERRRRGSVEGGGLNEALVSQCGPGITCMDSLGMHGAVYLRKAQGHPREKNEKTETAM